jgi:hypothetical protein
MNDETDLIPTNEVPKASRLKEILRGIGNFITEFMTQHLPKVSADTLEWLTIVVIHGATVPTTLAIFTGISDRAPPLDMVLAGWAGLTLLFIRAILLKNSINIITNGIGFIVQATLMAMILFR